MCDRTNSVSRVFISVLNARNFFYLANFGLSGIFVYFILFFTKFVLGRQIIFSLENGHV